MTDDLAFRAEAAARLTTAPLPMYHPISFRSCLVRRGLHLVFACLM